LGNEQSIEGIFLMHRQLFQPQHMRKCKTQVDSGHRRRVRVTVRLVMRPPCVEKRTIPDRRPDQLAAPAGPFIEDLALSRRAFLRRTALGVVLLTLPRPLLGGTSSSHAPAIAVPRGLRVFAADEYRVFAAVADRIVPGGDGMPPASALGVAAKADALLALAHPDVASDVAHLCGLFGSRVASFVFGAGGRAFLDMRADQQDRYLRGWMRSAFPFRRTAFKALKSLALACYYGDERAWPGIGYHGPLVVPAERADAAAQMDAAAHAPTGATARTPATAERSDRVSARR
jgi:hypothetical protein